MIANLYFDFRDFRSNQARRFKSSKRDPGKKDRDIQTYMIEWMKSGGRTTILTRDMSWVSGDAQTMLQKKALAGELTILGERRGIQLITDLEKLGATVYYYGMRGFVPETRFTIINDSKRGACVLVGRPHGQGHIIERYSDPDSPVTSLARDLAEICKEVSERRSKDRETTQQRRTE